MLLLLTACALENGLFGLFGGKGDDTGADNGGAGTSDSADDGACGALELGESGTVPIEACRGGGPPVEDPWALDVLWTSGGSAGTCVQTPVVAHLDDDNGDGRIDDGDDPEVIANHSSYQRLVLDGATGAVEGSLPSYRDVDTFAVVDVDADGVPDVVAIEGAYHTLQAFRLDGTLLWDSGVECVHFTIDATDLEGDGRPEILCEGAVFDGATGAVRFSVPTRSDQGYTQGLAGDLDRDGVGEVMLRGVLYDADGRERWAVRSSALGGGWPVWVQADADPEGEVAWVADAFEVYDTDGTMLVSVPNPLDNHAHGPACAGDFDGDGRTDVASPTGNRMTAFRVDGSVLWEATIDDASSSAGCAAFDFDGDGAMEVVFGGQSALAVYDGRTGALVLSDPRYESYTALETPSVADVDGDGDAELLACANSGTEWAGVVALTHAGDGWAHTGETWPTPTFQGVGLGADGAPPALGPTWEDHAHRSRPSWVPGDGDGADLFPILADVCAECPGRLRVVVQVGNAGTTAVDRVEVTLRDARTGVVLDEAALGPVGAGEHTAGVELEAGLDGVDAVEVVVDGGEAECDPADNRLAVEGCP